MMSRVSAPRPNQPRSQYFLSRASGGGVRTIALSRFVLWSLIAIVPISLLWGGAATFYVVFHDDMLGALAARQAEMQYAYEDRLAEARAEVDRVASRQLLDQNSFEGKVHELLSRQAQLEQHGSMVAALVDQASHDLLANAPPRAAVANPAKAPAPALSAIGAASPLGPSDSVIEPSARAFAPPPPSAPKPRPVEEPRDHVSLAPKATPERDALADLATAADNPALGASARLSLIAYSLDRMERGQTAALGQIDSTARRGAARLSEVVAQTGLSADALVAPPAKGGVGGPFIAIEPSASAPAFDKAYAHAARELERAEKLRELMVYLPVRAPLTGEAPVSSPFGYRTDPFLGRPALHPGVDLVQPAGSDIKATAAGRVTHAGWMGGYGEMVEIDHGNGLATRYGHMSEVLVDEGETVKAGQTIGRIGTTGRSTGPHLHYEVRVDGEPVDPERFLLAADAAP